MRVAKVQISVALLESLLPLGSKILSVRENEFSHTVEIIIEHSSFNELEDGHLPPTTTLQVWKQSHEDHSWISKVTYAS